MAKDEHSKLLNSRIYVIDKSMSARILVDLMHSSSGLRPLGSVHYINLNPCTPASMEDIQWAVNGAINTVRISSV
jgi:hypothetical protein